MHPSNYASMYPCIHVFTAKHEGCPFPLYPSAGDPGTRDRTLIFVPYIVQSTEYRVQSTEYRVQSTECRVQSTEYRVQNTECRVQSTEYRGLYK